MQPNATTKKGAVRRSNAGRKGDPRPELKIRIPANDMKVLEHLERATALTPDETGRMLIHMALWEDARVIPEGVSAALAEARGLYKP